MVLFPKQISEPWNQFFFRKLIKVQSKIFYKPKYNASIVDIIVKPVWTFTDEGKEIYQGVNSSPGVAVGNTRFSDVDYDGTFFVHKNWDNDWVGVVFSFQVGYVKLRYREQRKLLSSRTRVIFTSSRALTMAACNPPGHWSGSAQPRRVMASPPTITGPDITRRSPLTSQSRGRVRCCGNTLTAQVDINPVIIEKDS